ncbi:DUF7109 family protein [Halorientalis sp.]|jgi:hypothetical protein|uniref:DUF7109 family protein n=1 Tax=Halorientalis sp. TaxID=1931229 RepID=UPI00262E5A30|nr:hypothetical protein [Halorientalis sp.]
MDLTGDELAGVVDLFDALTPGELGQALAELAYRQGDDVEPAVFDDDVAVARETYHLVAFEPTAADGPWLVPGPVAFPELPEDATDLPHILDVPDRTVDRDRLGAAAEERFRADTARAVADGNDDRMRELLDASYELEVWGPVDLASARERLDDALT